MTSVVAYDLSRRSDAGPDCLVDAHTRSIGRMGGGSERVGRGLRAGRNLTGDRDGGVK
jgi:hypothetical protein